MLRLSLLSNPSSRRLSSLAAAQTTRAAASKQNASLLTNTATPEASVQLFEDEILDDMYSPNDVPMWTPSRKTPNHMDDAYLYGPDDQPAYNRQLKLEQETVSNAVSRYKKMASGASARGDIATHRAASDLLVSWFNPMTLLVQEAQKLRNVDHSKETTNKPQNGRGKPVRNVNGRIPLNEEMSHLISQLPADVVAVITIHVVLGSLMREGMGVPLSRLAFAVANNLRAELNMKKINALQDQQEHVEKQQTNGIDSLSVPNLTPKASESKAARKKRKSEAKRVLVQAMGNANSVVSAVNFAAKRVAIQGTNWTDKELLILGTSLIDLLMKVAKVEESPGKFEPALTHYLKFKKSEMVKVGMLQLSDVAMKVLGEEKDLLESISPKQQPMVVRPRPWVSPASGGYLRCHSSLIRAAPSKKLDDAISAADLTTLYDGLNALGDTAWSVNRGVLDTAEKLWNNGGGLAGLVTRTDHDVPDREEYVAAARADFEQKRKEQLLQTGESDESEDDIDDGFDTQKVVRKLKMARRKAQKLNRELASMRADTKHRIEQGRRFVGEEKFWLPHNVDFRGRAYPVPVHLQHMGCDLTRAMLTFSRPGVELGPRGVYWLKVHLANKLGGDKLSFDERIALAEDSLPMALRVANDPFQDTNMEWWSTKEDPFQLLAACQEFAKAMGRSGGEHALEQYESCLPVSMDGSCNGLQHYAALGRDVEGGTQVNLVPNSRPQDVYTGVASLVNERIDELAADGDEVAQLLKGKISRKVVKQTVMTSVYGVTLIGARQQIGNRLAEIDGFPEDKLFAASIKLASLTMSSLGDIFSGATRTMDWLYASASNISRSGHEVQWITPVGLPVIQPYRRKARVVVKTLMQRVTLEKNGEHVPVSSARQRSAFAPNFVHSIDSAHMLLTAVECRKRGLRFAAVHDSFWTNAACVDVMNCVLREEFVRLHSRDLLSELRESFLMRYAGVSFGQVPPRGDLDLNVVNSSPYFFS